jgi:predicted nuclease with TOPRIM domain
MKNDNERNSNDNNKKAYNKSNNAAEPNAIMSTIADLWQRYSPLSWSEMYNEYVNYMARMTEIYDEYAESSQRMTELYKEMAANAERMTELYKESAKSTEKMSKKWLNQFWKPLSEKEEE